MASNSGTYGLNNLWDIQVFIVIIVSEVTVVINVTCTGLGIDEILDLMYIFDLQRTLTLASRLLLLGVLHK
jgi:hypothetical protein